MAEWEEIEREVLSDGWATLTRSRLKVRRRDGTQEEQVRQAYDRGDGAVILPCDPGRGHVLLVRQFRWPAAYHGEDPMLVEAAAGRLDGDDPAGCIRKEAEEELGLALAAVVPLFQLYMSPGSVTERLHFFAARYDAGDVTARFGGAEDEGEETEVLDLPIGAAMAMVADGRIRDAKTVILLQWAAREVFGGTAGAGADQARRAFGAAPQA